MAADHRIVTKWHSKPPIPRCSPIDLGPAMGWRSAVTAAYDLIAAAGASLPERPLRALSCRSPVAATSGRAAPLDDIQPDLLSLLLVQTERRMMNQFPARLNAVERQGLNHLGGAAGYAQAGEGSEAEPPIVGGVAHQRRAPAGRP